MDLQTRKEAVVNFLDTIAPHELERIEKSIEEIKRGHKPFKNFSIEIEIPTKRLVRGTRLELEGHGWVQLPDGSYTHPFCATAPDGKTREVNITDAELTAYLNSGHIRGLK